MAIVEQNLPLVQKHLGGCGVVLSTEQTAALSRSLVLKQQEAALDKLTLWGKFSTQSGKDYLIAEGSGLNYVCQGQVIWTRSIYYSQDAIKWLDLAEVDEETAKLASKISTPFLGDPQAISTISVPKQYDEGQQEEPEQEQENQENEEDADKNSIKHSIPELTRLRATIDEIRAVTSVAPKGTYTLDQNNVIVPSTSFSGLDYPNKLESYYHKHQGPHGQDLEQDLRGTWCVQSDGFQGITVLKNLLFPGYLFYYNNRELNWGEFYVGDGRKNQELVFML